MDNKKQKIIILVLILIILFETLYYFLFIPRSEEINLDYNASKNNEQNLALATDKQTLPKEFVSSKFGISFSYDSNTSVVNENVDKISIRPNDGGEYGDGQWVEMFKKDPKISFQDAVRFSVIPDKDPKKCFVHVVRQWNSDYDISTAEIIYSDDTSNDEPQWIYADCGDYSQTNGIRYFYYDRKFPDRFYFFSIGQYLIHSGLSDEPSWQDTFKVIK